MKPRVQREMPVMSSLALRLTSASYTTGFRQISVVFAVLIGTFFLNEQSSKLRLFSSALILTGAVLVAI